MEKKHAIELKNSKAILPNYTAKQSTIKNKNFDTPLLYLQQTIGNRAVQGLFQAKLKISQPGDIYGREVERATTQVMIQRKEKENNGAKQIYNALFVSPHSATTCTKWQDRPTKEQAKTSEQVIVDQFKTNLLSYVEKNPRAVGGIIGEGLTETAVDRLAIEVNNKIKAKFGNKIGAVKSDKEIIQRVRLVNEKPSNLKLSQWLANKIVDKPWTSIADYCINEKDKRFQKVISRILDDPLMALYINTLASRVSGYIEEPMGNIFIHPGNKEKEAEETLTHEIIHLYAHEGYNIWVETVLDPRFVNDGFAEYLTRKTITRTKKDKYKDRFEFIRDKIASYVTLDDIAEAYFAGKVWKLENVSEVARWLFGINAKRTVGTRGKLRELWKKRNVLR